MSYIFEIEEDTVWSPALRVGGIWSRCAETLGEAFECDPGFDFVASDTVEIDPEKFSSYVENLLDIRSRSRNIVLQTLIDGVLGPALIMLERIDRPVPLGEFGVSDVWVAQFRNIPR